jgi:hypothetical protein
MIDAMSRTCAEGSITLFVTFSFRTAKRTLISREQERPLALEKGTERSARFSSTRNYAGSGCPVFGAFSVRFRCPVFGVA